VIDEGHRGGAKDESEWQAVLKYFAPAVQLGLTATPKRHDNVDTYAYFGEPVFIYSLKEGINDGYLTPFRVRQIATTLDDCIYTQDDTVVAGRVAEGNRYEEKDFNRVIDISARERKRMEVFMRMIDQREKTLVFCATQDHALAVRDVINQLKASKDPNYWPARCLPSPAPTARPRRRWRSPLISTAGCRCSSISSSRTMSARAWTSWRRIC
jgi:type I restriction enzyme, R subunit